MATVYQPRPQRFRVQDINPAAPAASAQQWVSSFGPDELVRSGVTNLRFVQHRPGADGPWSTEAGLEFAWDTTYGPVQMWVTHPTMRLAAEIYTDRFTMTWLSDEALQYDYEPVPLQ